MRTESNLSDHTWRYAILPLGASAGCVLLLASHLVLTARSDVRSHGPRGERAGRPTPVGVVPGEFETQQAILLAWPRDARSPFPETLIESFRRRDRAFCAIVRAVVKTVPVVILVQDGASQERVTRLLEQVDVPATAVRFLRVPFHTEWLRDYGPLGLKAVDGSHVLLDADYTRSSDLLCMKPHDDRMPCALSRLLGLPAIRVPLTVQHGNLLSDGRGLVITTQRILDENAARGYEMDDVGWMLGKYYGARQVVFLEPLQGEPTRHVDMFATFTSADTVVVGACSAEIDPVNAAILDRNAARLASASSPHCPLKVVRIPMPPRVRRRADLELWPTYTNVLYANGTLLVPVYPSLDPSGVATALAVYARLLPTWKVVAVDARPLLEYAGAIHCATLNLPSIGAMDLTADNAVPPVRLRGS